MYVVFQPNPTNSFAVVWFFVLCSHFSYSVAKKGWLFLTKNYYCGENVRFGDKQDRPIKTNPFFFLIVCHSFSPPLVIETTSRILLCFVSFLSLLTIQRTCAEHLMVTGVLKIVFVKIYEPSSWIS